MHAPAVMHRRTLCENVDSAVLNLSRILPDPHFKHFESSILRAPMHAQGENLTKKKSQCKDSTLFLVTVDP